MRFFNLEGDPVVVKNSFPAVNDKIMKSKIIVYMNVAINTGPSAYVVTQPFPGTQMPEIVTAAFSS